MTISGRLKAARAAIGLSQKEVAAQSGVSTRGYQGYEDGRSLPGAEAIAGLVRLGINANWLLTSEGPMLLADLAPKPAPPPQINVPALSAIIEGLTKAGLPPAKLGSTAVRYYLDALAEGLITPTGVGDGDGQGVA